MHTIIRSINRHCKVLEHSLRHHPSLFWRTLFIFPVFTLYLCASIIYAISLLFFPSHYSFTHLHPNKSHTKHTKAYHTHRSWQRRMRVTTVASVVVMVISSILPIIFGGQLPAQAASYSISCSGSAGSPTAVTESSYTSSDYLTFTDGGDGFCALDASLTVNSIVVQSGVTLTHTSEDTDGVTITAASITVDTGGEISAEKRGCGGAADYSVNGEGPDTDAGNVCTAQKTGWGDSGDGAGGGGHGGAGGRGDSPGATSGGATYGGVTTATLLGSGGGGAFGSGSAGGNGGGKIYLTISGTLTVNGSLNANGGAGSNGTGSRGGGGSGGSIYISTDVFNGSGSISANGGNGGSTSDSNYGAGGGGGGGIVYVNYNSGTFDIGTITASAGTAGTETNSTSAADGKKGSTYLLDADSTNLRVTSGLRFDDSVDYSHTNITIDSGANLTCGAQTTLTISATNNITDNGSSWTCSSAITNIDLTATNTLTTTGVTWNISNTSDLDLVAGTWTNSGTNSFTFNKTGSTMDLQISNALTLNNFTITMGSPGTSSASGGVMTFDDNIAVSLVNTDINGNIDWSVGAVTLDANSSMSADGKGCTGGTDYSSAGQGPNTTTGICTVGSSGWGDSADGAGGGGHGGAGGRGDSNSSTNGGATYDSTTAPSLYGSGGGGSYSGNAPTGASGGGKISLATNGNLTLNGSITAKGDDATDSTLNSASGGGSGGSLYIRVSGQISGTGSVNVRGGAGGDTSTTYGAGGGGGGGIIYIGYVTESGTLIDNLSASSNTPGGAAGTETDATNAAAGSNGSVGTVVYTAPSTPTISSPTSGTYNNSVNVAITGSTYSSNGASHQSTTWKVGTTSNCSTLVWSSESDTNDLESITVNTTKGTFTGALSGQTALASFTTYYMCITYTNAAGSSTSASGYSFTTQFTSTTTTQTWNFNEAASQYDYNTTNLDLNTGSNGLIRTTDLGGSSYVIAASSSLDGWTKRKAITLNNGGSSALTNYAMRYAVTYDADMQVDFDDLRFTNSSSTVLDYWLESKTNSDSAVVWIEVDSLAASGNTTIYMYYGNSSASSASNMSNTFTKADDFADGSISASLWTTQNNGGGSMSEASDVLTFSCTASSDCDWWVNNTKGVYVATAEPSGNWQAITKLNSYTVNSYTQAGIMSGDGGDADGFQDEIYLWGRYNDGTTSNFRVEELGTNNLANYSNTTLPQYLRIREISGTYYYDYSSDGSSFTNAYSHSAITGTHIGLFTKEWSTNAIIAPFEFFFVSAINSTEPTVSSTGSEGAVAAYSNVDFFPTSAGTHPRVNTLYAFSATLGSGSANTVVFQIGLDSDRDGTVASDPNALADGWYYHNGSQWTLATTDAADNDTATVVNSYIPRFLSDASVSGGDIYFKAFLVSDGTQYVAIDSITLTYNATPLTSNISNQALQEDANSTDLIDLDSYFTDTDDTLTYSILDGLSSSLGTMSIGNDGTIDISLTANANGSDTIQFRATDQVSVTADSNAVTLTVSAVNDTPIAEAGTNQTVSESVGTVTLDASSSSDIEGSTLTYAWTEQTDSSDACGISSFTVQKPSVTLKNKDSSYSCVYRLVVNDGSVDSSTDDITINVTASNDVPTLSGAVDIAIDEGSTLVLVVEGADVDTSSLTLGVQDTDSDYQNKGITLSSLFNATGKTGSLQWTPTYTHNGQYRTTFTVSDSNTTTSTKITVTVNDINSEPSFEGTLPTVAFVGGTTTEVLFDLDDYFTDLDGDELTYTVAGNQGIETIITDGAVQLTAASSYSGTESLTFTATDALGATENSNAVIVTVTSAVSLETVDAVTGTSKGEGIVTVIDEEGGETSWSAFPLGGAIPRLAEINGEGYVFVTKHRSGSTMHAYTLTGEIVKKKRLSPKLHWRKLATGDLKGSEDSEEIVVATRRDNKIYFKIFSFQPSKEQFNLLYRAQTGQGPIKDNKYSISINNSQVILKNSNGKTVFAWKPFK